MQPRWLIGVLILGLLGVGTTDGLLVSHKLAEARERSAHERLVQQQATYAATIRAVADRVRADVLPVQHILDVLRSPHAGDVYAARDALANGGPANALRADRHRLGLLRPPTGYRPFHRRLHAALEQMHAAVARMRTRVNVKDPYTLNENLVDSDDTALIGAEGEWRRAITDLFRARHERPPATPMTGSAKNPPASLVGWVFAADRRCIAADIAAAPLLRRLEANRLDLAAFRRGAEITRRLVDRLRALPVPRVGRAALRRSVLVHLRTLDSQARALADLADALGSGRYAAAEGALDRLRTTIAAMPALARAFRGYHAVACVNFIGSDEHASRPAFDA